ncbi:hypothetical protein [Arenimonas sp. MALMAid1274]|uniref:hypothetical protein n=1 Tax=Arenimonas sp. MALMAid1274 TaxID=3411630 RepID=UPI003BA0F43D
MKTPLLIALLGLALPALAADGRPSDQYYTVRMSIDADGRVTAAEPQGDIPQALRKVVRDVAERTSFDPARVAGRPVSSRTSINVAVSFRPIGTRYEAKVFDVRPGGGWQMRSLPPPYPRAAHSRGIGAYVMSYVSYDAKGDIDMEKSQIRYLVARTRGGPLDAKAQARYDAEFRRSVLQAMRRWNYTPDEVDGKPVPASALVPTLFCPQGKWSYERCAADLTAEATLAESAIAPLDPSVSFAVLKPVSLPDDGG